MFYMVLLNSAQEWLRGCFWPFSSYVYTFHYHLLKSIDVLKNVIHQIDSKNEWLLLSACFTAKFGMVFVLTLENAFS